MSQDSEKYISYDREVSNSIKSLFDLTTRIDERVEQLMANHAIYNKKLESCSDKCNQKSESYNNKINELLTKVTILEKTTNHSDDIDDIDKEINNLLIKINSLELNHLEIKKTLEANNAKVERRWGTIVNFVLQLLWVVIAAYLLYKLGIQAPNVP